MDLTDVFLIQHEAQMVLPSLLGVSFSLRFGGSWRSVFACACFSAGRAADLTVRQKVSLRQDLQQRTGAAGTSAQIRYCYWKRRDMGWQHTEKKVSPG